MKPYRVPEIARKYFQYDMIQNHTQLPEFPDARVHLLYIFLQNSGRSVSERDELYALVTSLVQVGLDTHESIDTSADNQGETQMRSRQLKVLAGDYFSSRFYYLLAQNGDIEGISLLSKAVSDVNVLKMNLYGKMKNMVLSAEEYLRHTVQLNMQLFLSFTPMIESSVRETWKTLLREFTQCETVVREAHRSGCPEEVRNGYSYWYMLERGSEEEKRMLTAKKIDPKDLKKLMLKHKAVDSLMDKLRQSVGSIQTLLPVFNGEVTAAQMGQLLDPFIHRLSSCRSAVREG